MNGKFLQNTFYAVAIVSAIIGAAWYVMHLEIGNQLAPIENRLATIEIDLESVKSDVQDIKSSLHDIMKVLSVK